MQYSLKTLNKIANLKNLTLNNFIEKLNLIGLEVDEINFETETKNNIKDIILTLKIPANRDDLLNEVIILNELAWLFLFEILDNWKKIKQNYFFILKQK